LGLVHLAVAEEGPDALLARVPQAAIEQVAVEPGLVDRRERPEAHADGGELPEVRHEARVRIRGQTGAGLHLATEVIELVLRQSALEEGACVHPRRGMTLVV